MLKEALEVFERMLEQESGERLVLDSHIPKDGTYRLIEIDGESFRIYKTLDIRNDKKSRTIIGETDPDYLYIKTLDYYSKLLEMNKPIDSSKVIHGNNYFSVAVKKESIIGGKLDSGVIEAYFAILKDPLLKYGKRAKTKELYEAIETEIGKPDEKLIDIIREIVLTGNIWEGLDFNKKDYVKLFFVFSDRERTILAYKRENKRYLIPNIYNNNEFNEEEDGEIIGLPSNNMGMNSKKPFLENKSRKERVPHLLKQQGAMIQSKMFDYFMGEVSKGRTHLYIDNDVNRPGMLFYSNTEEPQFLESGYYIRFQKEKNEVKILQADVVANYNPNMKPEFYLKNGIGISEEDLKKSSIYYSTACNKMWKLKGLIDDIFFERKLSYNFDTDAKDIVIQDAVLKRCLLQSRSSLENWFYRNEIRQAQPMVEKFSLELIENSIRKGNQIRAQHQFNLRWSLLDYFDSNRRIIDKMEQVKNVLRTHINLPKGEDWQIESDEEFAFAVGQMVSYLLSLSKANIKSEAVINQYLNARKAMAIKKYLVTMYKKYNYQINHIGANRASQLLEHILLYEPQKLSREEMLAGFVSSNLVYEKKNIQNKKIENKESEDMENE
ncbi:MAG: type I-B CRISPR-associated protein Cas8b/Csh1 [Lachnospiraceae bacterium]